MISNENSVASNVHGVQAPGAKKKLIRVSKPFSLDPELFEKVVIEAGLQGKNVKEVVRKKGSLFVLFDDDTEAEIGAFKDRDTAWEKQRSYRRRKTIEKQADKKKKEKDKEHDEITKQLFGHKRKALPPPAPVASKKENLSHLFQHLLLSENVLSYIFEQPSNTDVLEWDNFLKGLSKDAIMADDKLKKIMTGLMKSEQRILQKSMEIVKDRLKKAGFEVGKSKISANPENGRIRGEFYVTMGEDNKTLPFGIRIENGRSLIFIPNETKQKLNSMGTLESKALRAELIYTQENDLDTMDDVVNATAKRDSYFDSLEKNMDKLVNDLSPVEIAIIKKLIKTKYKNI